MPETLTTFKDRYETAVECGVDLTYPQWLENELLAAQRRPVDVANIIHIASHYGYVTIDAKKVLNEALPNEKIITRAHDLVGQSPISAASAALTAILENLLEQRGQTLIQVENNGNVSPVGETPESDMTRMVETETPLPGFEPPPDPEPEPSPTPKKAQAVPAQIIWIERDETKSSGSPMWRCDVRFQGGDTDRVNVFLHRIPDRNTFRFFQGAGYGDILQAMKKLLLGFKILNAPVSELEQGDYILCSDPDNLSRMVLSQVARIENHGDWCDVYAADHGIDAYNNSDTIFILRGL